jgi:methionine-rich copper-binding protein CopC
MFKLWQSRLVALSLAVLLSLAFAGAASAHEIEVTRSDPAAGALFEQSPAQVRAWFDEELQTKGSTLVILDADGRQVDNRDGGVDLDDPDHASLAVSLPVLAEGTYFASWYVVLLDGDASEGQFTFSVGSRSAAVAAVVGESGAAVSGPPAGAAPESPAAPVAGSPGLPLAWPALGLGLLVLVAALALLIWRGRAAQEA